MKNNLIMVFGLCALSTVTTLAVVNIIENEDKTVNEESRALEQKLSKSSTLNENESNSNESLIALTQVVNKISHSLPALETQLSAQQQKNSQRLEKLEKLIENLAASNEREVRRRNKQQDSVSYSPHRMAEKINEERELAIRKTYQYDEALSFEERDDAWAAQMETSIHQASSNELYAGSSFGAPTCKSTFCRVEATHSDRESRDKFELIRRELPNSFHLQHLEENQDGSSRSVIYFVREGQEENNIIFNSLGESS